MTSSAPLARLTSISATLGRRRARTRAWTKRCFRKLCKFVKGCSAVRGRASGRIWLTRTRPKKGTTCGRRRARAGSGDEQPFSRGGVTRPPQPRSASPRSGRRTASLASPEAASCSARAASPPPSSRSAATAPAATPRGMVYLSSPDGALSRALAPPAVADTLASAVRRVISATDALPDPRTARSRRKLPSPHASGRSAALRIDSLKRSRSKGIPTSVRVSKERCRYSSLQTAHGALESADGSFDCLIVA